jgi:uncharacterized protein YecT (DUF1311 family)
MLYGGSGILQNSPQESPKKITEAEIKSTVNKSFGPEACESLDQIYINHLEYYDFLGDGQQEAVVVASTCMTGTAGPDIHAVYKRDADGTILELPFLDAKGDPPFLARWNTSSIPLFGNRNYGLTIEDGTLVARWMDSTDRDAPLVVWYKWDGKKFTVGRMKFEGPFRTSYDCAKATKEVDREICYSPGVAALDVQLGQAYQAALQQLPSEGRQELRTQERDWLGTRERQCITKFWVECLSDLYTKRIAQLKPR